MHHPHAHRTPPHPAASDTAWLAIGILSAGALLWNGWRCVARTHRLRLDGRSTTQPKPLQTWEDEGGAPHPHTDAAA